MALLLAEIIISLINCRVWKVLKNFWNEITIKYENYE